MKNHNMEYTIEHYPNMGRFECKISGHIAFVEYQLNKGIITITKTYVPKPLEGRGIAGELVQKVAEFGYENSYDLRATCSYADVWLKRHPTFLANQQ